MAVSWTAALIVPAILFGGSMVLLTVRTFHIGNWILFTANGAFAVLGIPLLLVALIGGLVNYGPGALAVLALFPSIAILIGNAAQGRRAVKAVS